MRTSVFYEGPRGAVSLGHAPSFLLVLPLGPRARAPQSEPRLNAVPINEALIRWGDAILVRAFFVAAISAFMDTTSLHKTITRGYGRTNQCGTLDARGCPLVYLNI